MSIKSIAILGAGAQGWTVASALAHNLKNLGITLSVIGDTPTQALSISSMPSARGFHRSLGLNERELMKKTQATFKLATEYSGWSSSSKHFLHAPTANGEMLDGVEFQHFAALLHQCGDSTPFEAYSLQATMAAQNKCIFLTEQQERDGLQVNYGLHLNTSCYEEHLYRFALSCGVKHIKSACSTVSFDANNGNIKSLHLDDGSEIFADFFIDVTSAAQLMDTLDKGGIIDWSSQFYFNKCIDVETFPATKKSTTELKALPEGLLKTVPLQTSNTVTFYFNEQLHTDAQAKKILQIHTSVSDGTVRECKPHRRRSFWIKNCLALGCAAGEFGDYILSPLHLVQSGILRFIDFLPTDNNFELCAQEYNKLTCSEYDRIYDFQQAHFHLNTVKNSPCWLYLREQPISAELTHKIALFRARGNIAFFEHETWMPSLWASLFIGFNAWPLNYDPLVDGFDIQKVAHVLTGLRARNIQHVEKMPTHEEFLTQYCTL